MITNKFVDKLRLASRANNSLLCVGLDPDPRLMPIDDVFQFNRAIIDATKDLVCCYKPNLAFYEALGPRGLYWLLQTVEYVPEEIPVIGDVKRGDIGNTARAYAAALFDYYGFDAVTVNPYLGGDSLAPFLDYSDKGIFVLCRTSNPGSGDLQSLPVTSKNGEQRPLYMEVAAQCNEWNSSGNVGLVVGATYPDELAQVRAQCPDLPILLPGIGAQGGNLPASVANGLDSRGGGLIMASSRQILYSFPSNDYAQSIRENSVIALHRETAQSSMNSDFSVHAKNARLFDVSFQTRYACQRNGSDPFDISNLMIGYAYQSLHTNIGQSLRDHARNAAIDLRDRINECRYDNFWSHAALHPSPEWDNEKNSVAYSPVMEDQSWVDPTLT